MSTLFNWRYSLTNIEILAPVGNRKKLEAAVLAGADAVYLAGQLFGARNFAKNFSKDALEAAVDYCHVRDVKVYVTVNTLIKEEEIEEVIQYINFLYRINVDAVIIQDIWLLKLIKKYLPTLEVHISTQMTINSPEGVKFLEENKADRVILSREVSVEEIKAIQKVSNIPLEVFVHGALCVSYSGQCLMSSFIGGRSGNRGRCAQPCRRFYELVTKAGEIKDQGYLLSPKDLKTFDYIEKLKNLGVASLKIEGRMKSEAYVYTTVKAYKERMAPQNLKKVFNRDFTKGFLFNAPMGSFAAVESPSHHGNYLGKIVKKNKDSIVVQLEEDIVLQDEIQVRSHYKTYGTRIKFIKKNNRRVEKASQGELVKINFDKPCCVGQRLYKTYDVNYMKAIDQAIHQTEKMIPLRFEAIFEKGKKPYLKIIDNHKREVSVTGDFILEAAKNRPMTEEQIIGQFSKLGSTPYAIEEVDIKMNEKLFIPISQINKLRRRAIERLNSKRVKRNRLASEIPRLLSKQMKVKKRRKKINAMVSSIEQLKAVLSFDIDRIYYDDLKTLETAREIHQEVIPSLPRITHQSFYKKYGAFLKTFKQLEVANVGQIGYFSEQSMLGKYSLNCFNSRDIAFFETYALKKCTLSPELPLDEIKLIGQREALPVETIIYGYLPMMITRYNFIKESKEPLFLKNGYDEKFPLKERLGEFVEIYYHQPIFMIDQIDKIESDEVRLNFTFESPAQVKQVLRALFNKEKLESIDFTRGHFYKGVK